MEALQHEDSCKPRVGLAAKPPAPPTSASLHGPITGVIIANGSTDVEAQQRNDSQPAPNLQNGTGAGAPAPVGNDKSKTEPDLTSLEAPYFQPYWSPAFFLTCFGAILVIWVFCWLYVGAFWNPTTRLGNLHVAVLNCDMVPGGSTLNASFIASSNLSKLVPAPLATSLLSASIWNKSSSLSRLLRWENGSCTGAGDSGRVCGTPQQEADCLASYSDDVLQGGAWALLYFPSNFTASYLSFFLGSGALGGAQNQRPVAHYVYARGRDYSTYTYVGMIILNNLMPGLSQKLTWGLANNPGVLQIMSPTFLASGISVSEVNLAPVKNFGQHFASYIFCVLLWLGSSFVVVSSYQFKLKSEQDLLTNREHERQQAPGAGVLRLRHVARALMIKGVIAALFMFVLMVFLCIVLWALGKGTEQWHLNPGYAIAFGWYMSWSFIAINAVLLHVIGIERFSSVTAFLLILQLTSASGIMSIEICNRFFYIGKGLPFFYGVRGFRTIFFGTCQNKMYINWLVFTAYNLVFAPLGLLLVTHRVWTAPNRARKQHRDGNAAGMGGVILPVAMGS
ncbi:hypothetical protein Vretimale_11641 [Volvox reticuliferus]|nr:hypothetical protein Vretifemale_14758 [Volvox reticuliferus]GIM07546.1 hypothetical protein Vretimale_11641 [Volvox reticuliferus]